MPIRPENKKLYPVFWPEIRLSVAERSGWSCEGSPAYPDCKAKNNQKHPVTKSIVVLTVAHLNHDPSDNDNFDETGKVLPIEKSNLRHWCQRCHNTYDAPIRRSGINERKNKNQMKLFWE